MKLTIALIAHRTCGDLFAPAFHMYLGRIGSYAQIEPANFRTEQALFDFILRQHSRTSAFLALLDQRGKQAASEEFAAWLGEHRDSGRQNIVFAIGPANGWSEDARRQAHARLSLGPMTMSHELARLVLAEQIYRAFTILAGHPYHIGH